MEIETYIFTKTYTEGFAIIGVVLLLCILIKVVFISLGLIKVIKILYSESGPDLKSFGRWAVVTGSTDGIGKAYAKQLAAHGLDIILVSRNMKKLTDVAEEIETKYGVNTKVIQVDFSERSGDIYHIFKQEIPELEIGILVNNVGIIQEYPEYFTEVDEKKVGDILQVNTAAITMMTHMVLPKMEARHKGVIINISSGFSSRPAPLETVYSATKAYTNFFSKALNVEYKDKGIFVQTLIPHQVCTKMSEVTGATFFIPTAADFVKSAVKTIGVLEETYGCLGHTVQATLGSILPGSAYDKLLMRMLLADREKALTVRQKSD